MRQSRTLLAILVVASLVGTALMLAWVPRPVLIDALAQIEARPATLALVFAGWALIANCLVLPAGSLSLMAIGAILGTLMPAAIWFAAQLVTAPLVFRAAVGGRDQADKLIRRYLGETASSLLDRAAESGISTSVLLRLTPVLPSAPAALIAAWVNIDLRAFVIGTALAGWVRPLYFASIGSAAGSLARAGDTMSSLSLNSLLTLGLPFGCAAVALALRLWLARPARAGG